MYNAQSFIDPQQLLLQLFGKLDEIVFFYGNSETKTVKRYFHLATCIEEVNLLQSWSPCY